MRTDMQTISEIVVPVTALFLTLLALWLFCRITCAACNKLYGFLYKIAPEGSFRRQCAGIVLWVAMFGATAWCMRDELKMSNEKLIILLLLWLLVTILLGILVKILPDGIFKRVCGWIFAAVIFIPPLWLCSRILGKGGRGNNGIWGHVSRGLKRAGAAGAAAASKNGEQKKPSKQEISRR